MQINESVLLKFVAYDGDILRKAAGVLVKTRDRKQEILVRIEGIIFRCCPHVVSARRFCSTE